jgi:hypothetical protein
MIACASALGAKEGTLWTLSKSATTILVRAVAANWNLKTQLKVPQRGQPYTFFGARTAATFTQLSDDLRKCFHPSYWHLADITRVAVNVRFRG